MHHQSRRRRAVSRRRHNRYTTQTKILHASILRREDVRKIVLFSNGMIKSCTQHIPSMASTIKCRKNSRCGELLGVLTLNFNFQRKWRCILASEYPLTHPTSQVASPPTPSFSLLQVAWIQSRIEAHLPSRSCVLLFHHDFPRDLGHEWIQMLSQTWRTPPH